MPPTVSVLTPDAIARDLSLRDLTDPAAGPHAMQLLVEGATAALRDRWRGEVVVRRGRPVVPVEDNYDRLRYEPDAISRDPRYTRYVSDTCLLRTHTSALVPPALRDLARRYVRDVLLVCPGIVYRRDSIDRLHTGTPHQLDLWRVVARPMTDADLDGMIATVVETLLPGLPHRCLPASHPYTENGRQVDVQADGEWVEIGECGLAGRAVLAHAGLDTTRLSGLAMGLGLDRILMLRKGIPDIRLLRSADPRIAGQMLDLEPYRPASSQPAIRRDVSIVVEPGETPESVGDQVRDALGPDAASVEQVEILAATPAEELPPAAAERLGIRSGQTNVLLRVVLRHVDRTLTDREANDLRDRIFAALHRGVSDPRRPPGR